MKWILPILFLIAIFFISGCQDPLSNPFLKGLEVKGFEQATPLVVYNRNNIFDYINGEAEVYFPFGFQLLYSQSYKKNESDIRILVDVYDMGTYLGAKGVFDNYTQQGGSEIPGLGDSAWTDKHIVLFIHERYFFRVGIDPSSDLEFMPILKDLLDLSHSIDSAL
jgi:hypothetical protein